MNQASSFPSSDAHTHAPPPGWLACTRAKTHTQPRALPRRAGLQSGPALSRVGGVFSLRLLRPPAILHRRSGLVVSGRERPCQHGKGREAGVGWLGGGGGGGKGRRFSTRARSCARGSQMLKRGRERGREKRKKKKKKEADEGRTVGFRFRHGLASSFVGREGRERKRRGEKTVRPALHTKDPAGFWHPAWRGRRGGIPVGNSARVGGAVAAFRPHPPITTTPFPKIPVKTRGGGQLGFSPGADFQKKPPELCAWFAPLPAWERPRRLLAQPWRKEKGEKERKKKRPFRAGGHARGGGRLGHARGGGARPRACWWWWGKLGHARPRLCLTRGSFPRAALERTTSCPARALAGAAREEAASFSGCLPLRPSVPFSSARRGARARRQRETRRLLLFCKVGRPFSLAGSSSRLSRPSQAGLWGRASRVQGLEASRLQEPADPGFAWLFAGCVGPAGCLRQRRRGEAPWWVKNDREGPGNFLFLPFALLNTQQQQQHTVPWCAYFDTHTHTTHTHLGVSPHPTVLVRHISPFQSTNCNPTFFL